ncbi:MAG: DUF1015 domain-containing protein [Actinobacteria bacterium]|nr:DUF1015 domain-containing protein [Actinomycetota bacterium]
MVDILPFNGLIYNKNKIGNISEVISPPYDVVSAALKKKLYNAHPNNIINLILPKGRGGEKYIRAKKILTYWINKNILKFDNDRCFYIIEESFHLNNKIKKIMGFIGLTRLESYSKLRIIPHEQTSFKIKEDRLKLLSKCRANFGLVFTLYNDSQNKILDILKDTLQKNPFIDTTAGYDSTLGFKLWKVTDTGKINEILNIMKDKKLIIADGHHRYETSLAYSDKYNKLNRKKGKNLPGPEDFILTLYVESSQNDLLIFPTYRTIKFKNYPGLEKVLVKLADIFDIEADTLKPASYLNKRLLKSKSKGLKSFFLYGENKKLYFITLKPSSADIRTYTRPINGEYLNTDINILHKFLMDKITALYKIEKIDYTHSIDNVIENIDSKKFDIGVLLNTLTVKELEKICVSGYLMPEKSTYFYPKPCTGLVMYKFDR